MDQPDRQDETLGPRADRSDRTERGPGPGESPVRSRDGRGLGRLLVRAGVLAIPVVVFAIGAWSYRWIVDDGFIYLRIVDQITSGNGPVFNVGSRVEAFTSPVWVALLSVAALLLPVALEWIAVVFGIVLSIAGLVLAMLGARTLVRQYEPRATLVPAGVLVPAALAVTWIFATSGLEQGLVAAWLGGCLVVLARWAARGSRLPALGAALVGMGWLIRPEAALYSVLFIGVVVAMQWRTDGWPDRLRLLSAAFALPVLYQVFRMGYYGAVVANSAIAKDASATDWAHGWSYLVDFVSPYGLWIPLLLLVAAGYLPVVRGLRGAGSRRGVAIVGAFGVGAALNAAYIVGVGGDWMHGRLFLPALYALLAPVAVLPLTRRHAAVLAVVPWAIVCAAVLRPPQLEPGYSVLEPFLLPWGSVGITVEERGWGPGGPNRAWYEGDDGFYFDVGLLQSFQRIDFGRTTERIRGPTVALSSLGIASYALGTEWQVLDLLGLADPLTARFVVTPSLTVFARKPGHKKPLPASWLVALATPEGARIEAEAIPEMFNPLIPRPRGSAFHEQAAWARAALECPRIAELLESVQGPLGLRSVVRSFTGSIARTRLRVPPDPREAYRTHCGSGIPPEVARLRSER